jgi:hypothetical protein
MDWPITALVIGERHPQDQYCSHHILQSSTSEPCKSEQTHGYTQLFDLAAKATSATTECALPDSNGKDDPVLQRPGASPSYP